MKAIEIVAYTKISLAITRSPRNFVPSALTLNEIERQILFKNMVRQLDLNPGPLAHKLTYQITIVVHHFHS